MPNLFALNTPADGRRPAARVVPAMLAKAGGTLSYRAPPAFCLRRDRSRLLPWPPAPSNPTFYEPGFALPAAQHLVSFRNVGVLLVRQGRPGGTGRLLGFIPLQPSRRLFGSDVLTG